jgi:hypothetical protein
MSSYACHCGVNWKAFINIIPMATNMRITGIITPPKPA